MFSDCLRDSGNELYNCGAVKNKDRWPQVRVLKVGTDRSMDLINKVDMVCLSPVGYGV